ncbi:Glucosylceramidase, partial [Eufriesea mexicana]
WRAVLLLVTLIYITREGDANECAPRSFGENRIVCVCNATYCDDTPDNDPKVLANGTVYWYVSSEEGLRMQMSSAHIGSCSDSNSVVLNINTAEKYQTILGYGAAFTDSAGIHISSLSQPVQEQLLRSYFDWTGSRYSLARIPIGGTDFSTRPYTYDDGNADPTLQNFRLAQEDYKYKIPYVKKAVKLNPNVKIFSAVWSPPAWMKTNDRINGSGFLKTEYYQVYADYIVKFLEEYKKNDLDVWAVSTGNEPMDAFAPGNRLNCLGWIPETQREWIANNLGPTLENSNHNKTLILYLDDQRLFIPWEVNKVFMNKKAKDYVSGIAVHWYTDFIVPPTQLDKTHDLHPEKFILMTEACTGSEFFEERKVILGLWERGVIYILSIIQYMNHWGVGWVDWNIVLDQSGGPNWIKNYVDAAIIVNAEKDEFYKQPMYYAIKHFSRFVARGSVRVSISEALNIEATAFVTPADEVVVVAYNKNPLATDVVLNDPNKGPICLELPAHSMNTVIYAK